MDSRNIPVDELRERINEIEKGKPVYLICQSGLRSYIASRILEGNGYETYNFSGGFRFYDVVVNDRVLIERVICMWYGLLRNKHNNFIIFIVV